MSSANGPRRKPSNAAAADASDADVSCALDIFTTTTELLRELAETQPWTTAPFSVSDVTEIRRGIKTCLQSLNQIESALDKRE
jgi:hypothetical protein